jgi:hypothetical protein
MDLDKYSDFLLTKFGNGMVKSIYPAISFHTPVKDKPMQFLLVEYMESNGLIKPEDGDESQSKYKITVDGYKILNSGGWLKHLEMIKSENDKITTLTSQNQQFQNRIAVTNTRIQIGGLVIGVIALAVAFYGAYLTNKTATLELKVSAVQLERDSLTKNTINLFHSLDIKEKRIQQQALKIDSLLKNK